MEVFDGFEVFLGKRTRAPEKTPRVTIQRDKGTVSLNPAAHEALGHALAVELLYDRENKLMAIRPGDPEARHTYNFRTTGGKGDKQRRIEEGGQTVLIGATSFFTHYGIDVTETKVFDGLVKQGMLIVDLERGTPIPTRPRRTTKKSPAAGQMGIEDTSGNQ